MQDMQCTIVRSLSVLIRKGTRQAFQVLTASKAKYFRVTGSRSRNPVQLYLSGDSWYFVEHVRHVQSDPQDACKTESTGRDHTVDIFFMRILDNHIPRDHAHCSVLGLRQCSISSMVNRIRLHAITQIPTPGMPGCENTIIYPACSHW